MSYPEIWIWQRIVTPHTAGLARALVEAGCKVKYVAERQMSASRELQGWSTPELPGVTVVIATSISEVREIAQSAPDSAVHLCQGIRANGLVGEAQAVLRQRGASYWIVMETVNDSGPLGWLKRMSYRRLFARHRSSVSGVLAIGHDTSRWVAERGVPADLIYPFAYFLSAVGADSRTTRPHGEPFRFVFVGQLVHGKRVDLLIRALSEVADSELLIVGDGPLRSKLQELADRLIPGRVRWLGRLPMSQVSPCIADCDCLVLPSRYDGWGAVVSEALMVGTPVICSDRCGSAGVVRASGVGGEFKSGSQQSLRVELEGALSSGLPTKADRVSTAGWAECLSAESGAQYLLEVCAHRLRRVGPPPTVPWLRRTRDGRRVNL